MMNTTLNRYVLIPALALFPLVAFVTAQEQKDSGAAVPEGEWWRHSWFGEVNPSDDWKRMFTLGFGGETMDGNESGETLRGEMTGIARYKRFTAMLGGSIDITDKDYGTLGKVEQDYITANNIYRWDLGGEWFTSAGVTFDRDDAQFLHSRISYFSGVGVRVDPTDLIDVVFLAAIGRDEAEYDKENVTTLSQLGLLGDSDIDLEAEENGAVFSETMNWQVRENLKLFQSASFFSYFGDDLEDRWAADIGIEIAISRGVSAVLKYEARKEDNPVVQAVGGEEVQKSTSMILRIRI